VDGTANPVIDVGGNPVIDVEGATALSGLAPPDSLGGPAQAADRVETGTSGVVASPHRGAPDRFARWVLRIHEPPAGQEVHNLFSASMALSGTRCLLSYIVLPVLAPWLGAVPFIGPAIGIPVGVLALVFDVRAIRRFFQSDHRWRWVAAALYLTVMALVASLIFRDISRLM
jgi:hypothetical protein